jgi:chemotaxis protein CheC
MTPTVEQIDALQEMINIGVGRAASVLNEMLESHISLQVPYIKIFSPSELTEELEHRLGPIQLSAVRLMFTGSLSGNAQLVFPTDSASKLVSLLTQDELDSLDLDSLKIGTLSEIGNIVINGVMGSISNLLGQHFNYSLPIYIEDTVDHLLTWSEFDPNLVILLAQARFSVESMHIQGDIILIFTVSSFDSLIDSLQLQYE